MPLRPGQPVDDGQVRHPGPAGGLQLFGPHGRVQIGVPTVLVHQQLGAAAGVNTSRSQ